MIFNGYNTLQAMLTWQANAHHAYVIQSQIKRKKAAIRVFYHKFSMVFALHRKNGKASKRSPRLTFLTSNHA